LLNKYVSRIEEACGEGRDFIVILKYAQRDEAIKKILEKCIAQQTVLGVLIKGKYKGKEISVFRSGKLILKGIKDRNEAESILQELLA